MERGKGKRIKPHDVINKAQVISIAKGLFVVMCGTVLLGVEGEMYNIWLDALSAAYVFIICCYYVPMFMYYPLFILEVSSSIRRGLSIGYWTPIGAR